MIGNGVMLNVTTVVDSTDDVRVSNCIVEGNFIIVLILIKFTDDRVLVACTSVVEAGNKLSSVIKLLTVLISTEVTSALLMLSAMEVTNVSVISKLLWILLDIISVDCIIRVDVVIVISSTVTSSLDKTVGLVIG